MATKPTPASCRVWHTALAEALLRSVGLWAGISMDLGLIHSMSSMLIQIAQSHQIIFTSSVTGFHVMANLCIRKSQKKSLTVNIYSDFSLFNKISF